MPNSRSACCRAAISRKRCSRAGSPPSRKLLILDEPTRGIDVAAKFDIMDRLLALCASGLEHPVHFVGDQRGAAREPSRGGVARPSQDRRSRGQRVERRQHLSTHRGERRMKLSNWFVRDGAERPLVWPCITLVLLCALEPVGQPAFPVAAHARRPFVRRADRRAESRRAARARRHRHDARDRDTRHRYFRRRGGGDRGRRRGDDPGDATRASRRTDRAGAGRGVDRRRAERHVERPAGVVRRHAADHRDA